MKTHHCIFISALLFVILFYNEEIGLNLGVLGISYAVLSLFKTSIILKNRIFYLSFATSVLSSIAFAYYGDAISFVAEVSSLLLLSFKSKPTRLKTFMILPVFMTSIFTSIYKFFMFKDWLPKRNVSGLWQKTLAFVLIPLLFAIVFFIIYSAGSNSFAAVFDDFNIDINLWQIFCLSVLGLFIAFNFWNFAVERIIFKNNHSLDNEFSKKRIALQPTFSFLDFNSERTSGVVSLAVLNIMLLFFIGTYTHEQFYQIEKSPDYMSEETHNRVEAVIGSIIMAILVIMFYFKSYFNFDPKAYWLKVLAKLWIFLNLVLLIVTAAKNTEYLILHAFTYKKLGVYAFLLLSAIGLIVTFIKIQKKKTNAYLFNSMVWAFYGTVLACSFINWGGLITMQNSKRSDFATNFHLQSISFSEKQLLKHAKEKNNEQLLKEVISKIEEKQQTRFLSRNLFYETINIK